ncbi:two-component sensor histidine kinase [Flavobacterium chryseum]|uniref:histidine kinase dimerization/phosphoacceptor domain -containing protein n=1 Tax=Flavobacterium sp. P3160 TaxID=2512113 RepID=UPI001060737C|nr:histidine kinase dimerization/phosphoacceptor domain -containing protein [Flavobacterium sp. P3160]TDO82756.1 two-component sensor histidine kinase [Flavobacterium sp. P3160]
MLSNHYRILLFLLVWFTVGEVKALAPSESIMEIGIGLDKETAYNELQVKKAEELLSTLPENIDKIKILLKVSDWYEASYNSPNTLLKAFQYGEEALRISQNLNSNIYTGKCYLQLAMVQELRNNNSMIEINARKAIEALAKTDETDDLAESWVMVWSAKMRTNASISERLDPIFKAAALFEKSGNNKRSGDCYREISELYFSVSDFHKSSNFLKKAIAFYKAANLKESDIYPISSRLNIIYETEKKSMDIIKLKNKTLLQQSKLKNEVFLRNSMIIFVLLLLIILGLLYKSFRFKKKTNKVLETQRNEINKKNSTLQKLVGEKEWLLREIHHRVKNNLHMVAGLLASQAEFLKNEEALQAINSSQNRIHTMALIHQKLYQSENLSIIDMPSYIFELTEYLKDSFEIRKSIRFILDIDSFNLPLSHSIPIGLIFNEAVTNAIVYAFPDLKNAVIRIYLKTNDNKNYVLIIQDNGIGLPYDIDPYDSPSLGIKLMHGLSNDISGKFQITNENGTKITLEFSTADSNFN